MEINFKNKIIYQVYPSSFKDSNDDGIGDIKGIIQKLDYLSDLGIDILWISPFYKSPKYDNGYDVSNYYEIDPVYGTMDDFDELIFQAKKRNIIIMIDLVLNHTSSMHLWFQKALNGNKKYQNFYYFKDNSNNLPTNWTSFFGGSVWESVENLNKNYLHLYSKYQPDLNWENSQVRNEIIKIIDFWLQKGIKGIRFDVLSLISKPDFIDVAESQLPTKREYFADGPKVLEYIKEIRDKVLNKYSHLITVGEMSGTSIDFCYKYSQEDQQRLSMTFNFHHLATDLDKKNHWKTNKWNKVEFKKIIMAWQLKLQKHNSWTGLVMNNHDTARANSRFGDIANYWYESSTSITSLNFLLRGTPTIYQGEELGMTNDSSLVLEEFQAIESINMIAEFQKNNFKDQTILKMLLKKSRDLARGPMQWNSKKYSGFSKAKPWMKVNPNFKVINAESQIENQNSVFNFYKKIIQLRKTNQCLIDGDIEFIKTNANIFVFYRISKTGQRVLIALNLTKDYIDLQNLKINTKKLILTNYFKEKKQQENQMKLKPFQLKVFLV